MESQGTCLGRVAPGRFPPNRTLDLIRRSLADHNNRPIAFLHHKPGLLRYLFDIHARMHF
jgi:hypothetical protein